MPLTVRQIQPKHLYRQPLPDGIKNELHAVATYSLAGAIRQISSLAKHAESMLGELCDNVTQIYTRSVLLDSRIVRLREEIMPHLNVDEEAEISLVDYLETDVYTSDHIISQQLLSIDTSPESLTRSYLSCNPNPNLHQFTPLFDDGRNAMCLYSYPSFFFMSWRQSIEKGAKRSKVLELTESVEVETKNESVSAAIHYNKTNSNSSTLPSRGKSKNKATMPAAIQAYSSVRDKKNQRKRSTLKDDTFLHGNSEKSESSGYQSQHSSYNSLIDPDSAGSMGSQEGKFLTGTPPANGIHPSSKLNVFSTDSQLYEEIGNGLMNQRPVEGSANGTPIEDRKNDKLFCSQNSLNNSDSSKSTQTKVLHKKISSSRSDNRKDSVLSATMPPQSPGGYPHSNNTVDSILRSPKRSSIPIKPSDNTDLSINFRKSSLPSPIISPSASPEIRRRAEIIINQKLMGEAQPSPNLDVHQKRYSGVFMFPDPLEVMSSSMNQQQQTGNGFKKSMDDLSPDDFPPIDPELLLNHSNRAMSISSGRHNNNQSSSPQRQRLKTFGGTTARRPAPSPPTKPPLSSHDSRGTLPITTTQTDRPTTPLQRGGLPDTNNRSSPITRRHSIHSGSGSPSTPKRRAPPPPVMADRPLSRSSSRNSSIRKREDTAKMVTFEKQKSNDSSKQSGHHPDNDPFNSVGGDDRNSTGTPSLSSLSMKFSTVNSETAMQSQTKTQPNNISDINNQTDKGSQNNQQHPKQDYTLPISHMQRSKTISTTQTQHSRIGNASQTQHNRPDNTSQTQSEITTQTQRSRIGSASQTQHNQPDNTFQTQRSRTGSTSQTQHNQPDNTFQTQRSRTGSNASQTQRSITGSTSQTQHNQPDNTFQTQRSRTGSNASQTQRSRTGSTSQTQHNQPDNTFQTQRSRKDSISNRAQDHTHQITGNSSITTTSNSTTSNSRYGSFSESDKIAEMLRTKAKQRKQKSDNKRKKNVNQILQVSGIHTNITAERNDLLQSIRKGIDLKNVRKHQDQIKKQSSVLPWDVAAILERRQAMEISSDTEHDDGAAVNDTEWDEM